jgi:hypothetical protein
MRNGIAGTALDLAYSYALPINESCRQNDWYPYLVKAIQWNETNGRPDALTVISDDGGHGLMQLTSSVPVSWESAFVNVSYAITEFLKPAETYWVNSGLQGDYLIRAIGAEYNAGRTQAIDGHEEGNVDKYTTGGDYGARALASYHKILAGQPL